jgi:hypothetical protein
MKKIMIENILLLLLGEWSSLIESVSDRVIMADD